MSDDLTGGKNWMDNLKGPTLDYNNIFEEETGMDPGVFVWQIDNFYPIQQDETLHGKFYTGDCYIILHSVVEGHDLKHQIYFWIGESSSLDKKACAAVHAVNLRNMLKAKTRTSRQGKLRGSTAIFSVVKLANYQIQIANCVVKFHFIDQKWTIYPYLRKFLLKPMKKPRDTLKNF